MQKNEIQEFIRSVAIFSSCSDENIRIIQENSQIITMKHGSLVFTDTDETKCFYSIISGEVLIRKKNIDGQDMDLARFIEGDCFGEADIFQGESRNANALVTQDAQLLVFPGSGQSYSQISSRYPALGTQMLKEYLVQVYARIREVNNMVKEKSPLINEIRHQVYVDKLTGLANKNSFEESLGKLIAGGNETLAIIMFKPDNFKEVNDTYGHEAGDKVLAYIADLLSVVVDNRDMLFRYQGNENAIILPGATRESAQKLSATIVQFFHRIKLSRVLEENEKEITLTASVGVVLYPEHGKDLQKLVSVVAHLPLEGRKKGGDMVIFPEDIV